MDSVSTSAKEEETKTRRETKKNTVKSEEFPIAVCFCVVLVVFLNNENLVVVRGGGGREKKNEKMV